MTTAARRRERAATLGLLLGLVAVRVGAATAGVPVTPAQPAAPSADCEWTCVRWREVCDVDPRGVRRCRRFCEQFAKVCPP